MAKQQTKKKVKKNITHAVCHIQASFNNTSKATSFSYLFWDCNSLQNLDISNFDTSTVTDFSYMFSEVSSMTTLDLSHFDTSSATDMRLMFSRMSNLTSLNLSSFDVSNVVHMDNMFEYLSSIVTLDLSSFVTTKVESMKEMFRDMHKHNKMIAVPKIYKEITSRRVLAMEWIDGTKLTNLENVQKLGINPDEMIDIGVQCSLEQLLEHGFFHADPHPGNLLALEDGRLCYLDFGMMSEVSRESRSGLIQAVVHLVNKNFDKLSQDFVKLGFLSEEVNLEPIVPAFQDVFINAVEQGVSKMDFKSVTDDMSGVMYKFPFRLPPYYALIIRSLLTLEGIALSVDPNFKILGAAYPYFARRLMEDPDPQLRESLKEMLFDNKKFKWDRLEDLLSNAAKQTNLDLEKLLDEVINLLFSPNGGFLRNEIVEGLTNQIDLLNLKILKSFLKILKRFILQMDIIDLQQLLK